MGESFQKGKLTPSMKPPKDSLGSKARVTRPNLVDNLLKMQLALLSATPALRMAPPVMQMGGVAGSPVGVAPMGGAMGRGQVVPTVDQSILVQGGSLRTWSYRSPAVEQVQVVLGTEGRPLDADIELWHGPNLRCGRKLTRHPKMTKIIDAFI